MPTLTVITVCRNPDRLGLERTIDSVLRQKGSDIQYVLIDGASTDGTLELLSRYHDSLDVCLSEPDQGIYDAMNKGLKHAKGDLILFLNAKDTLFDDTVAARTIEVFNAERPDLLYGDVIDTGSPGVTPARHVSYATWDLTGFFDTSLCHQGVVASRRAFDLCGTFDSSYRIAADLDWLLRALRQHRLSSRYLGFILTCYDGTGISSSAHKDPSSCLRTETSKAIARHFNRLELFSYKLAGWLRIRQNPTAWKLMLSLFAWRLKTP